MYRKLILSLSIFFLTLYIFLPKVNAQTHPCENATNYSELLTCYENIHFSNPLWDCTGSRSEGQCRNDFGDQVDEKLIPWNGNPFDPTRWSTYDAILKIWSENRKLRLNPENQNLLSITPTSTITPTPTIVVTPTITPTPVENSISLLHDRCKPDINTSNNCTQNVNAQITCYSKFDVNDGIWSCGNLEQSQCRDLFINIIKNNMRSITGDDCGEFDYVDPNGTIGVGYAALTQLFNERYGRRILIEGSLSGTPIPGLPIVTPVITQAVIEDALVPTPISDTTLEESWEVFNCGFANGEDEGKNACCTNTISDIDPDFSTEDEVVAPGCSWITDMLGVCPLPDLSQIAEDKLMEYLNKNQVITGVDSLMEEGGIPKCFVGTCESDGLCHPETGADICAKYIGNGDAADQCEECMSGNSDPANPKKFYTALGCIDTSFDGIISSLFSLGLGIAGTTTLFCIIYAAFVMQTSQNNPERIQKAQENITACITGLVLIIFSIFIIRVIGVDLLRIPGFSDSNTAPQVTCRPGQIQCIGTTICVDSQDQCL